MTEPAILHEKNEKLQLENERLRHLVDTVMAERDDLKQRAHRSVIIPHVDFEPTSNQHQGALYKYAIVPDEMPDVIDPRDNVAAYLFGATSSDLLFQASKFSFVRLLLMFLHYLDCLAVF